MSAEVGILPAHHINTVAPQVITGTAASVWQVVMKVRVGRIHLPDPKAGVNLLQAAVELTLIGIMAVVTAEAQVVTTVAEVPRPAINVRV